jgi:phosphoribosylglycinamide formyltransferase-1
VTEDDRQTANQGPLRVAVLASGNGSNLQAIIDTLHGKGAVEVVGVGGNKPGCRAFERAAGAGIATRGFAAGEYGGDRVARDVAMADWLDAIDADLVVLAGYMQVLSAEFVRRFANRIINVHPALLPAFPGLHAIEQAVEAGVGTTGVTVHFVDEGVDTGPVIAQREVPVERGADGSVDTAGLETRIHAVEHELLPAVIADFAAGRRALG